MALTDYLNGLKKADDLKAAFGDTKAYHKWLKGQYKQYGILAAQRDKLAHSMRDGMMWQRFRAESDGESWLLYGFVEFDPEDVALATDVEIDEWFDENMRVRIHSAYDCTGLPFTNWIDWHRNPDGSISYVHSMSVDV